MTYAAVASLLETINLIMNYHQESTSSKFKDQVTLVREHIIFLRSFLEDAPDETNTYEGRIRGVANLAEDIIELLLSDSLLDSTAGSSESKLRKGKHELHCDLSELERVTEEIESIVKEVKERHTEAAAVADADLEEIISRLRGGSAGLEIIPIVGMGGIGKTTLARNVYNHPLIMEHFDIRGWATVSLDYSWLGVVLSLLSSMNKLNSKSTLNSDDKLFRIVYHMLWGKRYLIVLDDLWCIEVWEKLEAKIPHNFNGSRVLITTRLSDVASRVRFYSHIHEMSLMNEDRSWNLLRQKIFKGDPCPPILEYTGKMIAKNCRGLPLAIEVVSGILAAQQTQAVWEDIAENLINCEENEHLLWILHLSYTYLPHYLRPCFLYLGIFPLDHEIRVSKLVKLWVAEGLLDESGSQSFEETGEEYVEDLVERSLVSVAKRKSNGRIKSLSIHEWTRAFCTRQARVDNFYLHVRKILQQGEDMQLQRRVSIYNCELDFLQNVSASTIRTIVGFDDSQQGTKWTLRYLTLLRVLDISNAYGFFNLSYFPEEVFELFHLRYLAFNHELYISAAISNFQNLQTLIIRPTKYRRGFFDLPVEIWRMRQLRHLIVHSCFLPCQEEEAMFALENLQTLTQVVDFICSRETLKMSPNLKKLGIFSTSSRDYQLHNLVYLQNLEIMKIETHNLTTKHRRISPFSHPTLKKLSLSGLLLPWEDMKVVGSLPNLQVLKLRNHACLGSTWETNEGGFAELNFLLIDKSNLEEWITKGTHFPKLKCLGLHHCENLTEVPNDMGNIPTLELIEMDHQNKSLVQSAKEIQEDRHRLGNKSLRVHLV